VERSLCVTRELRVWLLAEDGWWGLVTGRDGGRWMPADDLRQSQDGPERKPDDR
jgi:hypothetical protein